MNAKGTTAKQKDQRHNVKWGSPPMGWIKGNFDALLNEPRKIWMWRCFEKPL